MRVCASALARPVVKPVQPARNHPAQPARPGKLLPDARKLGLARRLGGHAIAERNGRALRQPEPKAARFGGVVKRALNSDVLGDLAGPRS